MRSKRLWGFLLFCALWPVQASAENRFIVRDPSGLASLQAVCALQGCTVVRGLDGTLNQLFLVTTPDAVDPTAFLNILLSMPGIVAAELDQILSLVGGLNKVTTPPAGLTDSASVNYFGSTVWNGYASQPAARIVRLSEAQNTFQVAGSGIVADIDTGFDLLVDDPSQCRLGSPTGLRLHPQPARRLGDDRHRVPGAEPTNQHKQRRYGEPIHRRSA